MTTNFFAALMMLAIFVTTSVASAAFQENLEEGADLSTVKKLAIAMPNYYKVEDSEPSTPDLMREIYNAGRLTSTIEIISYDDIAAAIRRDTGVDIFSLDVPEAEKVFNANISRYADAYVTATVTNSAKVPWLFFYVYGATDQKLMYTYSFQSRLTGKNARDYGRAAGEFFRQFDTATANSLNKIERQKLKKRQSEIRAKKRKLNQVTYKTGKNKVELVRKKV